MKQISQEQEKEYFIHKLHNKSDLVLTIYWLVQDYYFII